MIVLLVTRSSLQAYLCWVNMSCNPGWYWTCCIIDNDLELFCLPRSTIKDVHNHTQRMWCCGSSPASYRLDKHSTDDDASPALDDLSIQRITGWPGTVAHTCIPSTGTAEARVRAASGRPACSAYLVPGHHLELCWVSLSRKQNKKKSTNKQETIKMPPNLSE